jgi:S-adenosylmethionine:tRNA ribosyltransferase-isomerase
MRTDSFDYRLPPHLVAQHPLPDRDRSRLLVVRRDPGTIEHQTFQDLPDLLNPGDLLVLNDTRVVAARLVGRRAQTGGKWEGLYLGTLPDGSWELLCRTRGRLAEGETVLLDPRPFALTLLRKTAKGRWAARPERAHGRPAHDVLDRCGRVPLPPYIRKGRADPADRERYQTVYARRDGAVAAPTAGLHFSTELLERLRRRGVGHTFVTLHVGLGTFQSIQAEDVALHRMHRERGELAAPAAAAVQACRARGGRVVAVGTTSMRVLETAATDEGVRPWQGETDLYIRPPFRFRAADGLITNFHLPRTSLLVLVSAFGGTELIRRAYREAIAAEYRFYSYGDAMLVLTA